MKSRFFRKYDEKAMFDWFTSKIAVSVAALILLSAVAGFFVYQRNSVDIEKLQIKADNIARIINQMSTLQSQSSMRIVFTSEQDGVYIDPMIDGNSYTITIYANMVLLEMKGAKAVAHLISNVHLWAPSNEMVLSSGTGAEAIFGAADIQVRDMASSGYTFEAGRPIAISRVLVSNPMETKYITCVYDDFADELPDLAVSAGLVKVEKLSNGYALNIRVMNLGLVSSSSFTVKVQNLQTGVMQTATGPSIAGSSEYWVRVVIGSAEIGTNFRITVTSDGKELTTQNNVCTIEIKEMKTLYTGLGTGGSRYSTQLFTEFSTAVLGFIENYLAKDYYITQDITVADVIILVGDLYFSEYMRMLREALVNFLNSPYWNISTMAEQAGIKVIYDIIMSDNPDMGAICTLIYEQIKKFWPDAPPFLQHATLLLLDALDIQGLISAARVFLLDAQEFLDELKDAIANIPFIQQLLGDHPSPADIAHYILDNPYDTDADGLDDNVEEGNGTNPTNGDTDGDTITDYDEIYVYKTDPNVRNPVWDSGFKNAFDGYSFENWGSGGEGAATFEGFKAAFGLTKYDGYLGRWITKFLYEKYYLPFASGGHCYGMAASSILYYTGQLAMPSGYNLTYDISFEDGLYNINKFFGKQ
ncbi:MAG: hypothetical protein QW728_06945, partial [Thermoplasmata archaeon]